MSKKKEATTAAKIVQNDGVVLFAKAINEQLAITAPKIVPNDSWGLLTEREREIYLEQIHPVFSRLVDDLYFVLCSVKAFKKGGRPRTQRQKEIISEFCVKSLADMQAAFDRLSDDVQITLMENQTPAEISEWQRLSQWARDYKKAYYGMCSKSKKKRKAFDFLRACRDAQIFEKESGHAQTDRERNSLLAPVLLRYRNRMSNF